MTFFFKWENKCSSVLQHYTFHYELLFFLPEHLYYVLRHVGVQSRCRLITEKQGRVGEHLAREGQTLHFATRNALKRGDKTVKTLIIAKPTPMTRTATLSSTMIMILP